MCGFWFGSIVFQCCHQWFVALFYKEKSLFVFFITFVIFFALVAERGIQLRNLAFNYVPVMGFIIIVMFWILFSVISAFPLWIDSELNLTFIDALFEGFLE